MVCPPLHRSSTISHPLRCVVGATYFRIVEAAARKPWVAATISHPVKGIEHSVAGHSHLFRVRERYLGLPPESSRAVRATLPKLGATAAPCVRDAFSCARLECATERNFHRGSPVRSTLSHGRSGTELTKPPLSARTSKQNGKRNAGRRHPNLIQAFGHGHLGMTLTAGTSRIVASLIEGRIDVSDLSAFQPDRFGWDISPGCAGGPSGTKCGISARLLQRRRGRKRSWALLVRGNPEQTSRVGGF
jgi:hypothetical protein